METHAATMATQIDLQVMLVEYPQLELLPVVADFTRPFELPHSQRINQELGADFAVEQFAHRAIYDEDHHRVEISLVSRLDQQVQIGEQAFVLQAGESILTEYSHKYTVAGFSQFAQQFGFELRQHWTDAQGYFAVLHLVLDQ